MKLREEERKMYALMAAIYDSGIPISFKGAMVLRACLNENGYDEDDLRHTSDIDANWITETPLTKEQIEASFQRVLDQHGMDLKVNVYRMYGEGKSTGLNFYDLNIDQEIFSMDMDINRPEYAVKTYQIEGFTFRGIVAEQILADKISAVSTDKVFRRVKDVIDLYYLSKAVKFSDEDIYKVLAKNGRELSSFDGFLNREDDLRHAYEKFRVSPDVKKPAFETVYQAVKTYLTPFLERARVN